MNSDDPEIPLEKLLRTLSFPAPPAALRAEVLQEAQRTRSERTAWHHHIWPPPAAWIALAALWMLIAAVGRLVTPDLTPDRNAPLAKSETRAVKNSEPTRPTLLAVQLHFRP